MRTHTQIFLAAGFALTLGGCSGGEDMKAEETVIGTQVEAVNAAKEVEQLLLDTSRSRADDSAD